MSGRNLKRKTEDASDSSSEPKRGRISSPRDDDAQSSETAGSSDHPHTSAADAKENDRGERNGSSVQQIQLDIAYRSYFRPYIVTRLNKMLNYSNPSTSCYSVHHVPENIHWGMPGGGIDDMSEYYCVNNKPVKLWIIGEVIKSWFRDQEGYNPRQVSITVQPLVHSDFMKLNTWLSREGVPPPKVEDATGVRAKCTMSSFNTPNHLVTEFKALHDAREGYKRLSELPTLHHTDIHQHDLVLLEATFHRHPLTEVVPGSNFRRTCKKWTQWVSELKLISICLLFSVPQVEPDGEAITM